MRGAILSRVDFYCDEVFSGKTEVRKVWETDEVLAFYHTKPSYETHVVVVPKEHVESLLVVNAELLAKILEVVRIVAKDLVGERGAARVITNIGDYQDSKHLHFHLVSGDKLA